jgi:hypothetical protein
LSFWLLIVKPWLFSQFLPSLPFARLKLSRIAVAGNVTGAWVTVVTTVAVSLPPRLSLTVSSAV